MDVDTGPVVEELIGNGIIGLDEISGATILVQASISDPDKQINNHVLHLQLRGDIVIDEHGTFDERTAFKRHGV